MNKRTLGWIVGAVALGLLAVGAVVLAGNGLGRGAGGGSQAATCPANLDDDGDGIPNGQDPDWVATCGSAIGAAPAGVQSCSVSCPNAQAGMMGGQGCGRMQGGARGCGGGCS